MSEYHESVDQNPQEAGNRNQKHAVAGLAKEVSQGGCENDWNVLLNRTGVSSNLFRSASCIFDNISTQSIKATDYTSLQRLSTDNEPKEPGNCQHVPPALQISLLRFSGFEDVFSPGRDTCPFRKESVSIPNVQQVLQEIDKANDARDP